MAQFNSTILFLSSCFLLFFVVAGKEGALNRREGKTEAIAHHYQTVKLSSFLSSSICSSSTKRNYKKRGSLEVVHKHGPCYKSSKNISKRLTVEDILANDQSRVDSIKSRFMKTVTTTGKIDMKTSKAATIPAKSGTIYNTGDYVVTVGMGTPKKDLSLIFDTGSDMTWTQCQPCARSCYSQQDPIYTPSLSTTYSNISCISMECSLLPSATGNMPSCSSSTCVYGIQYGDGSFSVGYFAKEKLTLSNSDDVIDDVMVGCGQNNQGDYGSASGLFGMGKGGLSIVSQTAKRYGKVFSYCLPSIDSGSGFLTFGKNENASNVKYTRLLTTQGSSSFYTVALGGIHIGRTKIKMSATKMIMDSGTVVTRLPPKAYSDLSKAFRAQMMQYPLTTPLSILDTCYDLSNHTDVMIPKISMVFGRNVIVGIPPQGTLIKVSRNKVCLPFAANGANSDPNIYGNLQQMTTEIVYNVDARKVGFSPGGCE